MSATFEEMVAYACDVLREMPLDRFAVPAEHYILTTGYGLLASDDFNADPLSWLKGLPDAASHWVCDEAVPEHAAKAATDHRAFDALSWLAATLIDRGEVIPPALAAFTSATLRGERNRPRDKGGRPNHKAQYFRHWWVVRSVMREFGVASAIGYDGNFAGSAAEIVHQAAKNAGTPTTLDAVANAYKYMEDRVPQNNKLNHKL